MEASINVTSAAWFVIDQVSEGFAHINPWAREGLMDELELVTKCGTESKHQRGLVYQL